MTYCTLFSFLRSTPPPTWLWSVSLWLYSPISLRSSLVRNIFPGLVKQALDNYRASSAPRAPLEKWPQHHGAFICGVICSPPLVVSLPPRVLTRNHITRHPRRPFIPEEPHTEFGTRNMNISSVVSMRMDKSCTIPSFVLVCDHQVFPKVLAKHSPPTPQHHRIQQH